jgi:hypothetical protein
LPSRPLTKAAADAARRCGVRLRRGERAAKIVACLALESVDVVVVRRAATARHVRRFRAPCLIIISPRS